ncbi:hypothetical protein [Bifidobacterium dolichotidis]|uniref:hypothetical protein n=1 Tax=Bifidobacterium dolichotidis TaxID=2306976 RepID=UPI001F49D1C2|nr:hypothetical protein [Bifidobacterium dolichotidis]
MTQPQPPEQTQPTNQSQPVNQVQSVNQAQPVTPADKPQHVQTTQHATVDGSAVGSAQQQSNNSLASVWRVMSRTFMIGNRQFDFGSFASVIGFVLLLVALPIPFLYEEEVGNISLWSWMGEPWTIALIVLALAAVICSVLGARIAAFVVSVVGSYLGMSFVFSTLEDFEDTETFHYYSGIGMRLVPIAMILLFVGGIWSLVLSSVKRHQTLHIQKQPLSVSYGAFLASFGSAFVAISMFLPIVQGDYVINSFYESVQDSLNDLAYSLGNETTSTPEYGGVQSASAFSTDGMSTLFPVLILVVATLVLTLVQKDLAAFILGIASSVANMFLCYDTWKKFAGGNGTYDVANIRPHVGIAVAIVGIALVIVGTSLQMYNYTHVRQFIRHPRVVVMHTVPASAVQMPVVPQAMVTQPPVAQPAQQMMPQSVPVSAMQQVQQPMPQPVQQPVQQPVPQQAQPAVPQNASELAEQVPAQSPVD